MLFAIARRSNTHPEVIRFLRDATTCGNRAYSPLLFDTVSEAEAEIATHTPGKYFIVSMPTLAKVDGRIEVATVSIRKPAPRNPRSKAQATRIARGKQKATKAKATKATKAKSRKR